MVSIASDNVPANSDNTADGSGNFVVQGQYGTLTINEDGSYSYARTPGEGGGHSDVFTYTYVDGDGDTVSATLTINIGNSCRRRARTLWSSSMTTMWWAPMATRAAPATLLRRTPAARCRARAATVR